MSIAVMPLRFSGGRGVPGGAGVDQGRLALGRADQDRVALADVEELDGQPIARRTRTSPRTSWARPVGAETHRPRREQDRGSPEPGAFHSLMSPPGSVFFRSSWTVRVSSASFSGGLGVTFEGQREHVAGLDAGGEQGPGKVDGVAVVGQEDGDRLVLALEAIEGQADGHAVVSLCSLDNDSSVSGDLRLSERGACDLVRGIADPLWSGRRCGSVRVMHRLPAALDLERVGCRGQREDAGAGRAILNSLGSNKTALAVPDIDDDPGRPAPRRSRRGD